MFFSEVGLVFVARTPGESNNLFYKKSEIILDKINTSVNKSRSQTNSSNTCEPKKYYSTPSQMEQLYNKSSKEAAEKLLGCKYY